MRALTRRLGAVALTTALASGTALVAAPAPAATNDYSTGSAGWLAGQLTNGVVHNGQYNVDDYGLSLDVYFALSALGYPGRATPILQALESHVNDYIEFDGSTSAGAAGKLLSAVEKQGGSPTSFGGVNLKQRLEDRVVQSGSEAGRGKDGPGGTDYSSTITQSYVVEALAPVSSSQTVGATVSFLLKQQCTAGYFREGLGTSADSYSCDGSTTNAGAPSVDSTAFAVQALVKAKAEGRPNLDDDIEAASTWLVSQQHSDGSFSGNGARNTNSTGLAATALAMTGKTQSAQRAGAWISHREVTAVLARNKARLARETGAIAYSPETLATAKKHGITTSTRDQFRRATAQAAIGVDAVKPLQVTVRDGYQHGGSTLTVPISGLASGERYIVRVRGITGVRGTAGPDGSATSTVRLPKKTHTYAVTVLGSSSARTASPHVRVLGPKTLTETLSSRTVRKGGIEKVTIRGLAPGETVRLNYRGPRIWNGTASSTGTAEHTFPVGRSAGKQTVTVRGRFNDRISKKYVTVVR